MKSVRERSRGDGEFLLPELRRTTCVCLPLAEGMCKPRACCTRPETRRPNATPSRNGILYKPLLVDKVIPKAIFCWNQ